MDNLCRTCLQDPVNDKIEFTDITEYVQRQPEKSETTIQIQTMIEICTGLKFPDSDTSPKLICSVCVQKTLEFHRFREQCWEANSLFVANLNQISDSESLDEDETNSATNELDTTETTEKQEDSIDQGSSNTVNQETKKYRYDSTNVCPTCGKTIKGYSNFRCHLYTHSNRKLFKCKLCDYASNCSLTLHMRFVHSNARNYVCDYPECDKSYKTKTQLKNHKLTHDEPRYECQICGRKLHTNKKLSVHLKIHYPSQHSGCEICGKSFPSNTKLNDHRRTHTKEYRHTCVECGKGFIQLHSWKTHMKNTHNKS